MIEDFIGDIVPRFLKPGASTDARMSRPRRSPGPTPTPAPGI